MYNDLYAIMRHVYTEDRIPLNLEAPCKRHSSQPTESFRAALRGRQRARRMQSILRCL